MILAPFFIALLFATAERQEYVKGERMGVVTRSNQIQKLSPH
jgi:hypothetical protein